MENTAQLTAHQIALLRATANHLFCKGTSSTVFCRILHNDYQILCKADINSPDDFHLMTSEGNKPMRDLLNLLGFKYTTFGIAKIEHPAKAKIDEIVDRNPMFKAFRKYYQMDQAGKNDYEVGCIQAANAIIPVIEALVIELIANQKPDHHKE